MLATVTMESRQHSCMATCQCCALRLSLGRAYDTWMSHQLWRQHAVSTGSGRHGRFGCERAHCCTRPQLKCSPEDGPRSRGFNASSSCNRGTTRETSASWHPEGALLVCEGCWPLSQWSLESATCQCCALRLSLGRAYDTWMSHQFVAPACCVNWQWEARPVWL